MPKVTEAHVDSRRRQILDAACISLAEKGLQQMTMRDIGLTAGLSLGAIYTYFSSKEEILRAMAEQSLRDNAAIIDQVREAGDARGAFAAFFRILTDPACCSVDTARIKIGLWAETVRNAELLEVGRRSVATVVEDLTQLVQEGQQRGQLRGSLDAKSVAHVMLSLLEGLTVQRAIDPEIDTEKYLDSAQQLLAGCFAAGAGRPTSQ
jgi:AcrR family transcriptional regulator